MNNAETYGFDDPFLPYNYSSDDIHILYYRCILSP